MTVEIDAAANQVYESVVATVEEDLSAAAEWTYESPLPQVIEDTI